MSVLERKRVAGFPDDHHVGNTLTAAAYTLGNAVVPAVITAIGKQLPLTPGFRFIDLFCGIGGFHLGMEAVGGQCVFAADIDKNAAACYKRNFNMDALCDVTTVPATDIPAHDVLCAGFPCQDYSHAGKRAGITGNRGVLFHEIVRIAKHHQPRFLVLENVPPIISLHGGAAMRTIQRELAGIGYHVSWKVLNAAYFGVPQARRRCYFLAWREDEDMLVSLPDEVAG